MPLLPSKKTGGFKIVIGKKINYGYQVAALSIGICLIAAVVYGILYASNSVTRLFSERTVSSGETVHFNTEWAQKNQRLALPTPSISPSPSIEPSVLPTETPTGTSTPITTPRQ